jgi:RNA polymerase sigma factor (sigma-70 family)
MSNNRLRKNLGFGVGVGGSGMGVAARNMGAHGGTIVSSADLRDDLKVSVDAVLPSAASTLAARKAANNQLGKGTARMETTVNNEGRKPVVSKKAAVAKAGARIGAELRQRATVVLEKSYPFIDSPSFRRKTIEAELFAEHPEPELPETTWYAPTRDEVLEGSLSSPKLMKADEERRTFYRYNYAKHRINQLQKKTKKEGLTKPLATELVEWDRRYEHYREYLTRTNLALVLAMAKRTRLGDIDFAEVVSEGNMALLRAVEKFNVDRGFKFSTYACRAILKAFSRISQKFSKYRTRFPVEFEPDFEKSDWVDKRRDIAQADVLDELKQIVDRNLADLSTVEQTVIKRRFNWEQEQDTPLTLEEVGKIIGVTKERVRQIQNKALLKIRGVMEESGEKMADVAVSPVVRSTPSVVAAELAAMADD